MSRQKKNGKLSTREFVGIEGITEDSLLTPHGELVFFAIKPTNLSVCSPESVSAKIYAMMTVLKGLPELEMLALNSKESYEDNKRYYHQRAQSEHMPAIARLLEQDAAQLDRLQVQMATAREFYIPIRLKEKQGTDRNAHLAHIHKNLEEQGFRVRQADHEDIKRLLAVYLEQNVTSEKYEDADGERWVVTGDL